MQISAMRSPASRLPSCAIPALTITAPCGRALDADAQARGLLDERAHERRDVIVDAEVRRQREDGRGRGRGHAAVPDRVAKRRARSRSVAPSVQVARSPACVRPSDPRTHPDQQRVVHGRNARLDQPACTVARRVCREHGAHRRASVDDRAGRRTIGDPVGPFDRIGHARRGIRIHDAHRARMRRRLPGRRQFALARPHVQGEEPGACPPSNTSRFAPGRGFTSMTWKRPSSWTSTSRLFETHEPERTDERVEQRAQSGRGHGLERRRLQHATETEW